MKYASLSHRFLYFAILFVAAIALGSEAHAQSPTPAFSKAFNPSTIGPGSTSTLTFTITNSSAVGVRDLAFTDTLPAGVTIADPAKAATTCGGTLSAPAGGGTITFGDGALGAARSCTISVDVTSSTPGAHTNVSGALTSTAGSSGTATATLTVATDRPGFTKSFSPGSVFFGGRSTLTFTIDNTANSSLAGNLAFTDTLPSGMVIASPSGAAKTCSGGTLTAPAGGSVVSLTSVFPSPASVAAGASCTVSVSVIASAVGTLGNTSGELTSTPGTVGTTRSSGKASASLAVSVEQISLTKTFTDDPVAPGGTVNLRFTIRNLNRGSQASSIAFTDDLDAVVSGLAAVGLPLSGPCGAGSSLAGTSVLSLTGGTLAAGASCTFNVTLEVPAGAGSGSFTNTTSAISAEIGGDTVSGAAATDLLFITAGPALSKSFTDDPVGAGGSVTLEFTITNSTSSPATDITFEDVFDVVLPTASASPAAGFCGAGSTAAYTPLINPTGSDATPARLVVSGASLAGGASCTFSITLGVVAGAATGSYPNTTSEITATVGGETVTGGAASDSLAIVAAPSLIKEFVDDPVAPGDAVTLRFTLTHDENAPGNATGIAFSDDLSATLSGLTATGLPASGFCGAGSAITGTTNLTVTGASLAPGDSCTFSVTLEVPTTAPAGRHTNTTSGVVATVLGVAATESAASDELRIAGVTLQKEFTDDPALPGDNVTLRFTIENLSQVSGVSDIFFRDDLDEVLDGLVATGLPGADPCGTGSAVTGSSLLTFSGGSLGPGGTCTFDVILLVPSLPAGTTDTVFPNRTSGFSATVGGQSLLFDDARDDLTIAAALLDLDKEFAAESVAPGGTVNLTFTLDNRSTQTITGIQFTDDLGAALSGLTAVGLPISACGGTASGTSVISFSGGSLAAGTSCSFTVALSVPATAPAGRVVTNTTSTVTGTVGVLELVGEPASDEVQITFLEFSKSFDGPASAGGSAVLTFVIRNLSQSTTATDLAFTDDLNAVLPGLAASGLPASDVCGIGSSLTGTSFLTLSGGSLLPGGSCTFQVTVQIPAAAVPGTYLNITSDLQQFGGATAARPATATLEVIESTDGDGDGVPDGEDVCAGTAIPEGVPTVRLGVNRYALTDGDGIFDTTPPNGGGPGEVFTIEDTAGCSCEQIIAALGLGQGHEKFGCSLGAMRNWVALVNP